MDPRRFEDLSRKVAGAATRRAALKILAAGLVAPVLLGPRGEEAAAGIPIVNCKPPGKHCDKDKKCCSGSCKKGICLCAKKGHQCWAPLEGALCCSQRCSQGRCN